LAFFSDEGVVYSPGVDAYSGYALSWGVVDDFGDFGPQAEDVPT
jgi:hypothetical protein